MKRCYIAHDYDIYPHRLLIQTGMRPANSTEESSSLLTILGVAPRESVLGMDASADVSLEGRYWFSSLFVVCHTVCL